MTSRACLEELEELYGAAPASRAFGAQLRTSMPTFSSWAHAWEGGNAMMEEKQEPQTSQDPTQPSLAKDLKDARLLAESIDHWRRIIAGEEAESGPSNCALCGEYWDVGCDGCPVWQKVGEDHCTATPYVEWHDHHRERHMDKLFRKIHCPECSSLANKEFRFLLNLLWPLQRKIIAAEFRFAEGMRIVNAELACEHPFRNGLYGTVTRGSMTMGPFALWPDGRETCSHAYLPVLSDEEIEEAILAIVKKEATMDTQPQAQPQAPTFTFKPGTTLGDLIATKPCLDEFTKLMEAAQVSAINSSLPLDNDPWNRLINSNPIWLDYCRDRDLMEKTAPPLSPPGFVVTDTTTGATLYIPPENAIDISFADKTGRKINATHILQLDHNNGLQHIAWCHNGLSSASAKAIRPLLDENDRVRLTKL